MPKEIALKRAECGKENWNMLYNTCMCNSFIREKNATKW